MADERPTIQIAMPTTGEAEWQALREPLLSGWLTQGPKVAAFEKAFAERHEAAHAIATTSCTTALHLILAALDIEPGDEVIVPAFTWVATANVVAYCGATPVLADVDRTTFNLDPQDVARRITERTRAVIPVHLFGLCADMHAIAAAAPGLTLIEDAACAVGSSLAGQPAGTLGTAGAFSFHPRKSITTGEGGMVTTNDAELAERIDMLRNHGANVPEERRHHNPGQHLMPEFNMLGFNYRMTDLQGAVGLVQIEKLDDLIDERRQWADYYCRELADVPWLQTPQCPEGWRHGWQAFVCYVDETSAPMPRNEIMEQLQARGVSTRPGTHAVHMLGYYANRLGLAPDDLPAARDCSRYTMAIPLHNRMSADDFAYVVKQIREL